MSRVFLSYRRSDSGGEAARLEEHLQQSLGRDAVFRDVSDIEAGSRFDHTLNERLAAAQVVLVLIGRSWLEELRARLGRPDLDYHRLEIAQALAQGKRVIPLLLHGSPLPATEALPEDLQALTRCHALTLRDEAWRDDVERLADAIGRPYDWRGLSLRSLGALLSSVVGVWLLAPRLAPEAGVPELRNLILLVLAGYAAVEAALWWRHRQRLDRLQ